MQVETQSVRNCIIAPEKSFWSAFCYRATERRRQEARGVWCWV